MVVRKRSQYENAMVGNAGLNFAAWQLSRRGWHALPTIRNARGSDLYVTNGDETFLLGENESTFIPLGHAHRLANPGKVPLEIIEVQSGSYLGEDDIVRFEDTYGRAPVAQTAK